MISKRRAFALVALLSRGARAGDAAVAPLGERGQVTFGGNLAVGASHATTSAGTVAGIGVAPSVEWFLARRFSWGLAADFACTFSPNTHASELFALSPRVGWLIPLGERASLWPRLSVDFAYAVGPAVDLEETGAPSPSGVTDHHRLLSTTAFVPLDLVVFPHLLLGVGPEVSVDLLHRTDDGPHPRGATGLVSVEALGFL